MSNIGARLALGRLKAGQQVQSAMRVLRKALLLLLSTTTISVYLPSEVKLVQLGRRGRDADTVWAKPLQSACPQLHTAGA